MPVSPRARRRMAALLVLVLLVVFALVLAYAVRLRQGERRLDQARQQGITAAQDGRYADALGPLGQYLHRYPDDVDAIFQYARARRRVETPDGRHLAETIHALATILDIDPNHHQARHLLMQVNMEAGRLDDAITQAELLLAKKPNDVQAARLRANLLGRIGRLSDALVATQQVLALRPLDVAAHCQLLAIMADLNLNDHRAAMIEHAQALVRDYPDDARFELVMGLALRLTGQIDDARQWIDSAAQHTPTDPALVRLITTQLDSVLLFDQAIELLGKTAVATQQVNLCRTYLHRLWERDRYQDIIEASSHLPDDPELLVYAILASEALGQNAALWIDQLHTHADNPIAATWLIILSTRLDAPLDRINALTTAQIRIDPHPLLFAELANAYETIGETDMAISLWRQAVHQAPTWADIYRRASLASSRIGNTALAHELARAAVLRRPDDPRCRFALVYAWSQQTPESRIAMLDQIGPVFDELIKQTPNDPKLTAMVVTYLSDRQQRGRATQLVRSILSRSTNPTQLLLLAERVAALELGDPLADACLNAIEQPDGPSLAWVICRAQILAKRGYTSDGLALLENQLTRHGAAPEYALARAQFLTDNNDPRATAAWIDVADKQSDNARTQHAALAALQQQPDRVQPDNLQIIIDRLAALTGPHAINWRLARARLLIDATTDNRHAAEAVSMLNNVIRIAPHSVETRWLLARGLARLGNLNSAVTELTTALASKPDDVTIRLELVQRLHELGQFPLAQRQLDMASRQARRIPDRRRVAMLLKQQGRFRTAIAAQREVWEQTGDGNDGLRLASLHFRLHELDQAESIARRLLDDPRDVDAQRVVFLAEVLAQQGKPEEAQQQLDALDRLPLPASDVAIQRGAFAERRGQLAQARQYLVDATQLSQTSSRAWHALLDFDLHRGDPRRAIQTARQAQLAMNDPQVFATLTEHESWLLRTNTLQERTLLLPALIQGDHDRDMALKMLRTLVNTSDNADSQTINSQADAATDVLSVQYVAAIRAWRREEFADAVRLAIRASRRFPHHAGLLAIAAQGQARLGHYEQALSLAQRWRDVSPHGVNTESIDALIAAMHLQLNQIASARDAIAPYRAIAVDNPTAHANILTIHAQLLAAEGQVEQAAQWLRPMLSTQRVAIEAWGTIAAMWIDSPATALAWLDELDTLLQQDDIHALMELVDLPELEPLPTSTTHAQLIALADRVRFNSAMRLGIRLDQENDLEQAARVYTYALALRPDDAMVLNNMAMLVLRDSQNGTRADPGPALMWAQRAVEQAPQSATCWDTLGRAARINQDIDRAIEAFQRAAALQPDRTDRLIELVSVYIDANQIDEARTALARIDQSPQAQTRWSPDMHQRMQQIHRQLPPL